MQFLEGKTFGNFGNRIRYIFEPIEEYFMLRLNFLTDFVFNILWAHSPYRCWCRFKNLPLSQEIMISKYITDIKQKPNYQTIFVEAWHKIYLVRYLSYSFRGQSLLARGSQSTSKL